MEIRLDPSLASIVAPGVLTFDAVAVAADQDGLGRELAAAAGRMRGASSGDLKSAEDAVRAMYRQVGLDPTRRRPSSEALLRRVRRGEPLPRINSLVDVGNWCSLETGVPYGLYDLDRVAGEVELRPGRAGEEYAGIRKDVVHVEGRMTLADRDGPFGNPSADSARTMVTLATRRALIVIFTPRALAARLQPALDLTSARVRAFCDGRETSRLTL